MEKQEAENNTMSQRESRATNQPPHRQATHRAAKYTAFGLIIVLVGAGGFFAGTQFAKTPANADSAMSGNMNSMRGGGMGRMGVFGTVTAITSDSITISSNNSGHPDQAQSSDTGNATSKTYKITASTKVTTNRETASVSDIKSGDTVMIRTSSSDTTSATVIDINPSMGGGAMGGAPGAAQSDASDNTSDATADGSNT